ncbi:MAG: hypothetical protein IKZ19_08180 [Clostridia bacterium]|nr:hypothetical protein [Clostridia bacterium]
MKPEAIERYLNALNNDELVTACIGIEYYKESVSDNNSPEDVLKTFRQILAGRTEQVHSRS